MDHFETCAAAGNACLAVEERMDTQQARIDARATEIADRMLDNAELWADALASFAYWPAASTQREPAPELVAAMRALMAGDHVAFGNACAKQVRALIADAAMDRALMEIGR